MSVMMGPLYRREEQDDGPEFPIQALPARMATHARNSSRSSVTRRNSSRQSRRSPRDSSSPAPLSRGMSNGRYSPSQNLESGEILSSSDSVSMMDPRRFTPSLHASLVAEILSLRRELDSKNGTIDHLEISLHETRLELDTSTANLAKGSKELRSLGRQLQLLEGGTSSALSELSRERDEAVESISDYQRRLDASQRRTRTQEEAYDRLQIEIEKKQQLWDNERRQSDREKHILQARLKTVADEFAAQQRVMQPLEKPSTNAFESDEYAGDSGLGMGSDTGSSRSNSPKSGKKGTAEVEAQEQAHSRRFSRDSEMNAVDQTNISGLSLADELSFQQQETDEEISEDDDLGALPHAGAGHKRVSSVLSNRQSGRLSSLSNRSQHSRHASDALVQHEVALIKRVFSDTGIQPSRPTSPELLVDLSSLSGEGGHQAPSQVDAHCQRCGHNPKDLLPTDSLPFSAAPPAQPLPEMASTSTQTATEIRPLSESKPISIFLEPSGVPMMSSATQTILVEAYQASRPTTPPQVPMIRLHPPNSPAPSRPVSSVLPPLHRNASTQADISQPVKQRSISVQTEEIRVDLRAHKLPPHLLPSAITSKPSTPEPGERSKPVARRRALGSRVVDSMELSKIGAENKSMAAKIKENLRTTCHFSDGEADEYELSDEPPFKNAPRSPKSPRTRAGMARRSGRLSGGRATGSRAGTKDISELAKQLEEVFQFNPRTSLDHGSPEKPAFKRHAHSSSIHRTNSFKRSVIVKSHRRERSDATGQDPPFPVPLRASSRRLPFSSSDGTRSPTPRSNARARKGGQHGFLPAREASLRKVQSAAAIARRHAASERSTSPVPSSTIGSSVATQPRGDYPSSLAAKVEGWKQRTGATSPPPPVPSIDRSTFRSSTSIKSRNVPSSRYDQYVNQNRFSQLSSAPSAAVTDQATSSVQGPGSSAPAVRSPSGASDISGGISVADAIAHTMVGEWLYKYTRRRKSFGVNTDKDDTDGGEAGVGAGGQRHKRWVWLAPYERAVLWSSKQPIGNTAVLGKSGRKLQISNVIDVADHSPAPKGCPDRLCDRSILVLTPNRALKFTAPTLERHHVWLTALSFLSHAPNGSNDLLSLPSPLPLLDYTPDSTTTLQSAPPPAVPTIMPPVKTRRPVRDSIRLAKAKVREPFSQTSIPTSTSIPEQQKFQQRQPGFSNLSENRISMASLASATPPPIARYPPPPPLPERHAGHHYRKRSNTAGRVQLSSSVRAFSAGLGIHSTGLTSVAAPAGPQIGPAAVSVNAGSEADNGRHRGVPSANNSTQASSIADLQSTSSVSSTMRGDPYSRPYRSAFPSSSHSNSHPNPNHNNTNSNNNHSGNTSAMNAFSTTQHLPPVPSIPSNFFDAMPPSATANSGAGTGAGMGTVRMQAFVGGGVSPSPSMALEQQDAFPEEGLQGWGGYGRGTSGNMSASVNGNGGGGDLFRGF